MDSKQLNAGRQFTPGGQHRGSVGVTVLDAETPSKFIERHRRAYAELGQPLDTERLRKCLSVPSQRTLVERFNELVERSQRELEAAT